MLILFFCLLRYDRDDGGDLFGEGETEEGEGAKPKKDVAALLGLDDARFAVLDAEDEISEKKKKKKMKMKMKMKTAASGGGADLFADLGGGEGSGGSDLFGGVDDEGDTAGGLFFSTAPEDDDMVDIFAALPTDASGGGAALDLGAYLAAHEGESDGDGSSSEDV